MKYEYFVANRIFETSHKTKTKWKKKEEKKKKLWFFNSVLNSHYVIVDYRITCCQMIRQFSLFRFEKFSSENRWKLIRGKDTRSLSKRIATTTATRTTHATYYVLMWILFSVSELRSFDIISSPPQSRRSVSVFSLSLCVCLSFSLIFTSGNRSIWISILTALYFVISHSANSKYV